MMIFYNISIGWKNTGTAPQKIAKRIKKRYIKGGCYFFTVVTYQREKILVQPVNIERLRYALKRVMDKRPFEMESANQSMHLRY